MLFKDTNIGKLILDHIPMEKTASDSFDPSVATKTAEGLLKTANIYSSETSYSEAGEMMKTAAKCLYDLKSAFDDVMEKNAKLHKALEVQSIVEDMANNGFVGDYDIREKVAELMDKTAEGLEVVKEAVKLAGNRGGSNVFFAEAVTKVASKGKQGMFDNVI